MLPKVESGLGADAEVTGFGQIFVQPNVTVDEIAVNQTVVKAEISDTVEITDLPEGVTEEYALSLIEKMKGITLGESRTVKLELPSVRKSVAKVVSPLSPEKTEP